MLDHLLLMAILGHFVGDYLLQSYDMAIHKTDKNIGGTIYCTLHVAIYALAVCIITGKLFNPYMFIMVFLSHYPIDRWGLGGKWLSWIGGRNLSDIEIHHTNPIVSMAQTSFAAIVYTITDNTLHILLMYGGILGLNAWGLL